MLNSCFQPGCAHAGFLAIPSSSTTRMRQRIGEGWTWLDLEEFAVHRRKWLPSDADIDTFADLQGKEMVSGGVMHQMGTIKQSQQVGTWAKAKAERFEQDIAKASLSQTTGKPRF